MVYFTPSKVRFLSYNIHGDCRDRKEFFRYEAAMSMQKKEGCDMHSLPKEDAAQCRIEPTIQKRRIFRTAIRKSKKLEEWRKIRHRRPKMAENPPTYVPVLRYNIDVIRWMPQRFLCAVNCIHSKETFSQTNRQFSDHQQIAWEIRTEIKLQAREFRWYEPWKQNTPGYRYVDPWRRANMRRRDDGESRSGPRSAWTCQAKQARDDLHGSKGYFLTASRWLGRSPCNVRQPRSATAKRGYDVIPQITACNTPGSWIGACWGMR